MVVVVPIDVVVVGIEVAVPGVAVVGRGTPPVAVVAGIVEVPIVVAVAARQTRKTTALAAAGTLTGRRRPTMGQCDQWTAG